MKPLTEQEREELNQLLKTGKSLPDYWRQRLFPAGNNATIGKEYRLAYEGKLTREEVLAQTPAAPWQLVRTFCTERPHGDDWRNLLVWGDNLPALRELLGDQTGPNRFGTRGKIKLIYIDPPFATRQDFMKDKEKAYRDKVVGAQFIEFLRRRLILLRELLANDGTSGAGQGEPRTFFGRRIAPPAGRHRPSQRYIDEHVHEYVLGEDGMPQKKSYLKGATIGSVWDDISPINSQAEERLDYPTQKPEELLERIIYSTSKEGDIVLDAFAGAGTTAAVAEKLGRRWIAMDCGKLAIYTTQKRMFSLTSSIGAAKKDTSSELERVEDWTEHLRDASGILLVTENVRKGESEITLDLLYDLAAIIRRHCLIKKGSALSLVCPEEKLLIPANRLDEPEDGPGSKCIEVDGVEFRLSVIAAKDRAAKEQPLPPKEFALYRAGVYDMSAIKELPWIDYRPFVLKLFGVREHSHQRYGVTLDGYIGTDSVLLWNYPDHKTLTLDYGYIDDLHRILRGKPRERFYVIAPVIAMDFAEDEVSRDESTYIFLKVPLSVLLRLIEKGAAAALKQPTKEQDVNEVIDAVGFDFISQPHVTWTARKETRKENLFTLTEYVLQISEFRSQTLATDPEDFQNFETFSMAMLDLNYHGDVFRLDQMYWGDDLLKAAGGLDNAKHLEVRVSDKHFTGKQMMVILCDRYGNEKSLLLERREFEGKSRRTTKRSGKAKGSAKKVGRKK